jgi:hypothetical protein
MKKKKMEFKCPKHRSNEGYIDSTGTWRCWKCTRENEYFYPKGKIIEKCTIGDYEVRILSLGSHSVVVEKWNTKKKKKLLNEIHDYLSTAIRSYQRIVDDIDQGIDLERDEVPTPPEILGTPTEAPRQSFIQDNSGIHWDSVSGPHEITIQTTSRPNNISEALREIQEYDIIYYNEVFRNPDFDFHNSIFLNCYFTDEVLGSLPSNLHSLFHGCTIINEGGIFIGFIPSSETDRIYNFIQLAIGVCEYEGIHSIEVERLIVEVRNRE